LGLDINIETKHDSYYNKTIFLHEDLDYNQMYNYFLIMMTNFELF
jgi:hypothetical protein